MTHSLSTIRDYVCLFYGISKDELLSKSRRGDLVKARHMINLIAGYGRERETAQAIGRARCTQCTNRKHFEGNMRFSPRLTAEYEKIKKELIQYEIS